MAFEGVVFAMGEGGEVGVRGAGEEEGRKKNDFLDECLWPWATSAIIERVGEKREYDKKEGDEGVRES
jgi:hypothetical protein